MSDDKEGRLLKYVVFIHKCEKLEIKKRTSIMREER